MLVLRMAPAFKAARLPAGGLKASVLLESGLHETAGFGPGGSGLLST
jgi:hypothetical protein